MKIPPRRRARELAVQGLYQWQLNASGPGDVLDFLKDLEAWPHADQEFLREAVVGALGEAEALRERLAPYGARDWEKTSPVERAILLLGAWELLHRPDIPARVAINEAIELAKRFGGTDGHKYVNGILDKLAADARPGETAIPKKAKLA